MDSSDGRAPEYGSGCPRFDSESNSKLREGSSLKVYGVKYQNHQGRKTKGIKANLEAQTERMSWSKLCFFLSQPELFGLPVWEGYLIKIDWNNCIGKKIEVLDNNDDAIKKLYERLAKQSGYTSPTKEELEWITGKRER